VTSPQPEVFQIDRKNASAVAGRSTAQSVNPARRCGFGQIAAAQFSSVLFAVRWEFVTDRFAEDQCRRFYAPTMGRPSLEPGRYFRLLLVGYFEGLDAERGIAWRAADSLAVRRFVRLGIEEAAPDHSTISRTRRLIDVDTHSMAASRLATHDSGSGWVATPFLCDAFIHDSMPVYPGSHHGQLDHRTEAYPPLAVTSAGATRTDFSIGTTLRGPARTCVAIICGLQVVTS
jgi:transposase-like protein DUF772